MARVFEFELGGQSRVFRFEKGARKALEREFCGTSEFPGLFAWVYKKVLPIDELNQPTLNGHYESQIAFLHAALKHIGARITRDKIEEWLEKLIEQDVDVRAPVLVAIAAAWEQGLFGRRIIMTSEEDTSDAGKVEGDSEVNNSNS